jgi:glycosyltransferase involved in cell wall biosynthesis
VYAITLVTSVLNGMPYLAEALASAPADPRVEHIVIDAGSADGTLELVSEEPRLRLLKRPGLPLYDAWNEGVAAAQGQYIWFVNADDRLAPGALPRALDALAASSEVDVLAGEADAFVSANGDKPERVVWRYEGERLCGSSLSTLLFGAPVINAKIMRRDLIAAAGGFDTRYRFAADREFLLRLSTRRPAPRWRHMPVPFYRYRIHPGSKTLQPDAARRIEISHEHQDIARRYLADAQPRATAGRMLAAWLAHEQAVTALRGAASGRLDLAFAAFSGFARHASQAIAGLALAAKIRRDYRERLKARAAADHERNRV